MLNIKVISNIRQLLSNQQIRFQSFATCKALERNSHAIKTDTIQLGGYPIHYVISGNGEHPVFCLPGILGNTKVHTVSLIDSFDKDRFTFITWDQPGYGKSSPPERKPDDNSLLEDTELMMQLMKILDYPSFSVIGWSGGGCSALLAALKYPSQIRKLVAWGAFTRVNEKDAENFRFFEDHSNQRGKMMEVLKEEYGDSFFHNHFSSWLHSFRRVHSHCGGHLIPQEKLKEISAPTLILHGTEDGLVKPEHGEYLVENIGSNAKLVKWPKGKHNIHLRYDKEFNEVVQKFLAEKES